MKKIKFALLMLSIILFIFFIANLVMFMFVIRYDFPSSKTIEVNSSFNAQDTKAKYRNKKISLDHIGEVDTKKIGKYKVEYHSNEKAINKTKSVIYDVVDTTSPKIEIVGDKTIYSNYGDKYEEPGYKATDNYDLDITDKVTITGNVNTDKIGEYKISYTVTDSSNNSSEEVRTVIVKDIEKPKIEVYRSKNSYLILNGKIDINKYKAVDNYDGDITNKVKVTGEVNPSKAGLYKVTYSVADSSGNEEILETTINVQKKNTRGIPVLMYHWFYDDTIGQKAGKANSHNYLSKTKFEQQVKYLVEHNYYFPTYEELEKYIDKKIDLPEKSIILTADDAVTSFFTVAAPVLKQYEVPMTTFVRTKYDVWKKFVDNPYISFQSHTDMLHKPGCKGKYFGAAMCLSYNELYKDTKNANDKIDSLVDRPVAFAYPYGHHNDTLIKALKNNDIRLAFTISNGRVKKGANKYLLPRVRISKDITLKEFINKIK